MEASPKARAIRARWVLPVEGPPISNGVVTCYDGQVVSVGNSTDVSKVEDLGNAVLLPGLVNCHTHLEFCGVVKPLPVSPSRHELKFTDWIAKVVQLRRAALKESTSSLPETMRCGLIEGYTSGCAVIGEIATRPWADYASITGTHPYLIYFFELLGSAAETADALCWSAREALQQYSRLPGRAGLSPHAPYTTHPAVLACAVNLSATHFVPVSMHLAESREEIELLDSHTGPFVDLLMGLNAWHPGSLVFNKPMGYLQQLAPGSQALIIHGNYLDNEEIAFLGDHRQRMSVVYCPRTHAYFGHSRYPLTKMLNAGVRVAIGTDSRASNPDLSLFEELRHITTAAPEISPETVLRMGTLSGAEALGIGDNFGSLSKGKLARFAVGKITTDASDPYEALWTAARMTSIDPR